MVQFIRGLQDPAGRLSETLGTAIAQGIGKNLPQPEMMVQKGLLSEAFKNLNPDLSYEEQLAQIAPALLTTQGGADALQTLAPILQQRSKNRAVTEAIKNQRQSRPSSPNLGNQGPNSPQNANQPVDASPGQITPEESEQRFRNPQAPQGKEPTYPQVTAGPEPMRVMSPAEMQDYALDLMENSSATGTPMSYQEAMQLAQSEQQNREAYNQRVQKEKNDRQEHIRDMSADVVERAVNSGMIEAKDDESRTVAERLGYEARNADTPAERWEYVRSGLREFQTAREGIRREASLPGPFQKLGRMMIGNYKSKEQAIKDLKPFLSTYKKYGLYDEAREALSTNLGLGPEDVELAINPFSKEENAALQKFPKNPNAPKHQAYGKEVYAQGDAYRIKDSDNFSSFKDEIEGYLKKNPGTNLVTMRGRLNQENRYAWEDISKAVGELMEEKRFTPDNYQYSQLAIINKAPLPGLTEQFKEFWMGTK